jgi:hypothetical protein
MSCWLCRGVRIVPGKIYFGQLFNLGLHYRYKNEMGSVVFSTYGPMESSREVLHRLVDFECDGPGTSSFSLISSPVSRIQTNGTTVNSRLTRRSTSRLSDVMQPRMRAYQWDLPAAGGMPSFETQLCSTLLGEPSSGFRMSNHHGHAFVQNVAQHQLYSPCTALLF